MQAEGSGALRADPSRRAVSRAGSSLVIVEGLETGLAHEIVAPR